ncbi:MAG: PDDEXK nuclease domain-containing protein [Nanoarchaeota archaeon]
MRLQTPNNMPVYEQIKQILEKARANAFQAVNFAMVLAYWNIGRIIVEEEQKGNMRAGYGGYLIKSLSKKLSVEFGPGFTRSNLFVMKQLYFEFPKVRALSGQLAWTHYRLLLRVGNKNARNFYMLESINNKWSTRELERQIDSLLFERLAVSKDKKAVMELSLKGQIIQKPKDIIKDPYVLEFLGMKENTIYLEKDIEQALISKSKDLLLELGKGFSLVARQKRINVGNEHYYIDLVFYNYLLKCFILIDLKVGKLTPQDIGQMDFYVNYYNKEERLEGDNPTIGLILCSDKNETMAKYTLLKNNKKVFASKYRFVLPDEETLKERLSRERNLIEQEKRLNQSRAL